jgi:drug/metabolite transporter (DMT)-like permease
MRVAKWIANLLASQIVWVLLCTALGTLSSAILKAENVLSNPYGLVALALFIAAICVALIQKIQRHRAQPEIDRSRLAMAIWTRQQEKTDQRADRIIKETVDRETKG